MNPDPDPGGPKTFGSGTLLQTYTEKLDDVLLYMHLVILLVAFNIYRMMCILYVFYEYVG
jgi:hypothetical protein